MGAATNDDLAATKVRPPMSPAGLVARDRLTRVLDEADAASVPLVLISAPAGSGKSTLVAAWASSRQGVAWLQLEDGDADPARFWRSVVAAIARVDATLAERLGSYAAGSASALVDAFVNEASSRTERLIVVLDDYHLVDEPAVHRDLERLVDLAPDRLTVVVITRADPPFRLGRMRVRGRVRELRSGDLRFDPPEAVALLGRSAADLDGERLEVLVDRTEGWAAGLVLAGLSLARSGDAARFVEAFRGDDQLVSSYLADELLSTLTPVERRRMVEASVLHRLSGPLLDAVTGSHDGAAWLAGLAATNQLVIRLDPVGEWYRYHHLLRDLLLLEARRSMPEALDGLHRRAAAWFEASGRPAAAVDHLLAAGDREAAMASMRIVGPDLLGTGQLRTLRNVLERLAAGGELDAICSILAGWDHYLTGRYETAQHLLDRAMEIMPDDMDPMRAMPLRINLALGRGDVRTALEGARAVLAAGDVEARPSELTTATGAALAWAGLADDARATLAVALVRTKQEQRITAHAMALVASTVTEYASGDVDAAVVAARRSLDFATSSGLGEYHGMAPALAVRFALATGGEDTGVDPERAVALARRATTTLGLGFVLTLVGDALAAAGDERGRTMLEDAAAVIRRCPDPGILGPLLDRAEARHRITASAPVPPTRPKLVEQLSERELAVLRFLPSSLSLPQIAQELFVSPNTVKTQCSAIYRKLGVAGRQAAVQSARQHGLL